MFTRVHVYYRKKKCKPFMAEVAIIQKPIQCKIRVVFFYCCVLYLFAFQFSCYLDFTVYSIFSFISYLLSTCCRLAKILVAYDHPKSAVRADPNCFEFIGLQLKLYLLEKNCLRIHFANFNPFLLQVQRKRLESVKNVTEMKKCIRLKDILDFNVL